MPARHQGEKTVHHRRNAGLLLPPFFHVVDKSRGRWSEKYSWSGALRKHHPEECRFMEKEQLKVSTKTQGLNFQDISCIESAWHRLMMLEGLAEAGEG